MFSRIIGAWRRRRYLKALSRRLMEQDKEIRLPAIAELEALPQDERKRVERMTREIWLSGK